MGLVTLECDKMSEYSSFRCPLASPSLEYCGRGPHITKTAPKGRGKTPSSR